MGDTVLVSELLCRTEQIERKGTSDLFLLFDRSICVQIRMAHCKSFLCGALAVFLLLSLVTTKVDSIFYKKKRSFKMECRWQPVHRHVWWVSIPMVQQRIHSLRYEVVADDATLQASLLQVCVKILQYNGERKDIRVENMCDSWHNV